MAFNSRYLFTSKNFWLFSFLFSFVVLSFIFLQILPSPAQAGGTFCLNNDYCNGDQVCGFGWCTDVVCGGDYQCVGAEEDHSVSDGQHGCTWATYLSCSLLCVTQNHLGNCCSSSDCSSLGSGYTCTRAERRAIRRRAAVT